MITPMLSMPAGENECAGVPALSHVFAGLSRALDLAEGQPEGHATRTALIASKIADELRLSASERLALVYATLLKDLAGSSIAAKMCFLFGADDRALKGDLKRIDWSRPFAQSPCASLLFGLDDWAEESNPDPAKDLRGLILHLEGESTGARLAQTRCQRGMALTRRLGLPETVVTAISQIDEHWDGAGRPQGRKGDEISLLARIVGLAQAFEVYCSTSGRQAAVDMARERRGRWFEPELVDLVTSLGSDAGTWLPNETGDAWAGIASFLPADAEAPADEAALDRIAMVFADVVDGKSPWTYRHSAGVSRIAVTVGAALGWPLEELRLLSRAALLHDLGNLGVSNLLLDKPGRLSVSETIELRQHVPLGMEVLRHTPGFSNLAEIAGSHHERMDGSGYHRGLDGSKLSPASRLLAVADVFEALSASRPYRVAYDPASVRRQLLRESGRTLCSEMVAAILDWARNNDDNTRARAPFPMLAGVACDE